MIEKKKNLQLLIVIFTMGWIIPICIGIGFLCAHYDLNIVNKGINSFPHLDFGMTMLKYGGMWLGYSGLLAFIYLSQRITSGKWLYPFNSQTVDEDVG